LQAYEQENYGHIADVWKNVFKEVLITDEDIIFMQNRLGFIYTNIKGVRPSDASHKKIIDLKEVIKTNI